MHWVDHTIWWHVYPLGFVGAPIRNREDQPEGEPRLQTLVNWLDYAVELGVSGLLLGPVFAASTHGYDTTDHFRVDPRLGNETDFDELVRQCHRRGLRVVLDGVFSHVGVAHPAVTQALRCGPRELGAELFDIDWQTPGGPTPRVFEGHDSLVRLNHDSDATIGYVREVMRHWLSRGADGWRLDAAYSVPPAFWRAVLRDVRKDFPQAWFLGEVIHGDYTAFVEESTIDSVTQYELWKAIWSSLLDRNFFELAHALERNNGFLRAFTPNTFVGNHDVTRIASRVGGSRAVLALVVLMTVGGIPSVYYGDEQAFTGIKEERLGGDDSVRPPMPQTPDELSPLGIDTYQAHRQLIGFRRRHPWLVRARTESVLLESTRFVYRTVSTSGPEFIETTLDIGAEGAAVAAIRDEIGDTRWKWTQK